MRILIRPYLVSWSAVGSYQAESQSFESKIILEGALIGCNCGTRYKKVGPLIAQLPQSPFHLSVIDRILLSLLLAADKVQKVWLPLCHILFAESLPGAGRKRVAQSGESLAVDICEVESVAGNDASGHIIVARAEARGIVVYEL